MNGSEHYLSKIERNLNAIDTIPEYLSTEKKNYLKNIEWASNLSNKLNNLDYNEREAAIDKIHQVLDDDYLNMGFSIESQTKNR